MKTPETFFGQRPSAEYRQARHALDAIQVPQVNFFHLDRPAERHAFLEALSRHLHLKRGWEEPEALLKLALAQNVLADRFELHLEDYFKLKREKSWWKEQKHRQVLERAKHFYDRWENSVIAEYTWEQQKRFVRLPPEELFYEVAYSRNRYIISPQVQERLRQETFAIVGLGVGSAIAYLLVLSGAQRFVVIDGGDVTLHDHNRLLGSDVRESGINHAVHWARLALRANPYLHIRCYPRNLSAQEMPDTHNGEVGIHAFLAGTSILIEEADGLLVKAAVRKAAKTAQMPVFMGADLGRGGQVQYDSGSSDDPMLSGRLTESVWQELQTLSPFNFERMTELVVDVFIGREGIPTNNLQPFGEALQAGAPFWPQVGLGAFASTRGVVNAILDYLGGQAPPTNQPI